MRSKKVMKTTRGRRRLFAGSLTSAGVAIAGLTPATAHADGSAKGP